MTITHDYESKTPEEDQLWIIRSELQTALARIDELIKQKQWENKKS